MQPQKFHTEVKIIYYVHIPGADPGVGKGRGTNRLSVARWLEKIELAK